MPNATMGTNANNDNSTRYNVSCTPDAGGCTGGGTDITLPVTCSYSIFHYAQPTDITANNASDVWNLTIDAVDLTGSRAFGSTTQEVNTLTSFRLHNGTLDFGTLALSGNSTSDINATVSNLGNEQLDFNLDGYARGDTDGLAMNCTVGNITIGNIRHNTETFTYTQAANNTANGFSLTYPPNAGTQNDRDLRKGVDNDREPRGNIVFRMGMPSVGVGGTCTGTINIVAVSDPTGD